jgi:hypothetical protein
LDVLCTCFGAFLWEIGPFQGEIARFPYIYHISIGHTPVYVHAWLDIMHIGSLEQFRPGLCWFKPL